MATVGKQCNGTSSEIPVCPFNHLVTKPNTGMPICRDTSVYELEFRIWPLNYNIKSLVKASRYLDPKAILSYDIVPICITFAAQVVWIRKSQCCIWSACGILIWTFAHWIKKHHYGLCRRFHKDILQSFGCWPIKRVNFNISSQADNLGRYNFS